MHSLPRKTVRFAVWAWGDGVDGVTAFCLPSLMQPNNVPWLVQHGYTVSLDFFTLERDRDRVGALAQQLLRQLRATATDGEALVTVTALADAGRSAYEITATLFQAIVRLAVDTSSHVIFAFAGRYFGDGSIRNIVTYGQKPRVSVSGLGLQVKAEPFARLLARHQAVTGGTTISNARLADIALDTLVEGLEASNVDTDRNASYASSGALRQISDDLHTYTFHAPAPVLFTFEESDLQFFNRFLWNVHLLDHIWPTMLIAQNRWRVMASSDLFLLVELERAEAETARQPYPLREGMLYNDDYDQEHLHGRNHQTILWTLRRERLPENSR